MDKLEEMDKFLERYNLPRLTQEEIENMNRPIRSTKIATVFLKLPKLNQEEIENMNRHITRTETETVIRNLPTNIQDQVA